MGSGVGRAGQRAAGDGPGHCAGLAAGKGQPGCTRLCDDTPAAGGADGVTVGQMRYESQLRFSADQRRVPRLRGKVVLLQIKQHKQRQKTFLTKLRSQLEATFT